MKLECHQPRLWLNPLQVPLLHQQNRFQYQHPRNNLLLHIQQHRLFPNRLLLLPLQELEPVFDVLALDALFDSISEDTDCHIRLVYGNIAFGKQEGKLYIKA